MIIPIELRFEADKDSKSAFRTDKTIKSHDVNSVEFHITIEGLELTDNHTAKILSIFHSSKSQVNVDCEIVEGKIIYKPDTNLISRHEHVTNYVYVYNNNQSLDVREFIYTVDLSKIDETSLEVKEVYDQSYADLLAEFEQALEDYKSTLPQASELRAEIDVILNQFGVDSQRVIGDLVEVTATAEIAEASRVQAESERVQAETERKEAETLRETNYEQLIDTALIEADVVEKVDNKVTELTPQINNLTAQLAQKADQAFVDSQFSSIVSGAPKGTYTNLTALQTAYPNGADGVFLVLENGHWYYWNSTSSAWSDGGLYQATSSDEFLALNLINNGDFSNGLTGGWESTNSTTSVSVGANNTAAGTSVFAQINQSLVNLTVGDKYYLKASVIPDVGADYIAIGLTKASESQALINNPEQGEKISISGVFTTTDTNAQVFVRHRYPTVESALGKTANINHVLVINLSAIFGKGYEPSKTETDDLMMSFPNGWFDGSTSLADSEFVYRKLIATDERYAPILEIPRTGMMVKGDNDVYHGRQITGTTNQIEVLNGDGVAGHPTIKIPNNPTLMRPEIATATFGDNISPALSEWTGVGNATFSDGAWTVNPKGQLKTTIPVEANAEYEVEIEWTDTSNYVVTDIPRLVVKFGDATLPGQFVGYSDAGYKFTVKASSTGNTELILGDGVEDWYAVITDIIIRKVISKVTPSGRLGIGGFDVTTFANSIAIGGGLKERTSGDYNTAYGRDALRDTTVGTYNTAIGARALQQNTTGYHNIGIGFQAMQEMQSGYYNTGVGYSVMRHITTGNWNVAMGNEAMRNISSGIRNTSIGSRSMNDLTTGSFNVAMGREAGMYPNEKAYTTKTGDNNVFIGYRTGQSHNEETDESTAVGSYATARTRGTALGRKALAGGVGSVAIGTDSTGIGAEAQNENEFVLGTDKHNVKAPGTFGIAQYTPTSSLDARGTIGDITSDDNYMYVKTSTGWKRTLLETW